ncbi:MAG: LysE family transporter [Rhodospirillales bacterium]|nr:LysE family transporter [Rhodospirillales bacterium]
MYGVLLLLKAMLAGFVVAVPIGAIGAMCLRRAIHGRWVAGLVTGLGAAVADSLLAMGAMFGLTLLTRYILENQKPVLLMGGVFLIFVGARMIAKRRPKFDAEAPSVNHQLRRWRAWTGALSTGFALTIINPATLIAFVGVFAGLGLFHHDSDKLSLSWLIVVGVFTGSMLWWATLTGTAFLIRRHLSLEFIVVLNVVLGLVVVGFGAASLLALWDVRI